MSRKITIWTAIALAAFLAMPCSTHAAVNEKIKTKTGYNKAATQAALRTVGKKTLKQLNVAAKTFDVTYSATRLAVNLPGWYDAADNMLDGILHDKCWAIAVAEVECTGATPQSNAGVNSAHAESVESCWWHGSAASANVTVSRAANWAIATGADHSESGSADWYGIGGVGDNITVGSSVLEKMGALIQELIVDPPLAAAPNHPVVDPTNDDPDDDADLDALFSPAGFAMALRVYYPSATPSDETAPLFYDAEITGFLAIMDETADLPEDAFGIQMVIAGDYYDRDGNVTRSVSGTEVANLSPSDFTYQEHEVEIDGELFPAFGFGLSDFPLSMPVDCPDEWSSEYPGQYIHVDFDVLAGGNAVGAVPEPTALIMMLTGVGLMGCRRRLGGTR